jgi:flagellar protein FlaG
MEAIGTIKAGEIKATESVTSLAPQILGKNRESAVKIPKGQANQPKANAEEVREDTRSKIENIAQALNQYVKSTQRDLKIQVHEATGNIIVKVLSKEDGKIIREIPPEKMLNLAAKMEEMTGILFNENV